MPEQLSLKCTAGADRSNGRNSARVFSAAFLPFPNARMRKLNGAGTFRPMSGLNSKLTTPFENLLASMGAKRVPMLDVVRAIAAFLVVIDHFRLTRGLTGTVGVTIFFALSGYLITGLLLAENRRTGTVSLPGFYRRRSLRIFPAFYVFWCVYIGIMLWNQQHIAWPQAISSLFYYSNYYWGITGVAPLMVITWSLSIEQQFYLIWPALFLLWRKSPRQLLWGTTGLIVISFVSRLVENYVLHLNLNYLMYAFEARADSLMIGCLLAIAVATGHARRFVNTVAASSVLLPVTLTLLIFSGVETLNNTYNVVFRSTVEAGLGAILIVQLLALSPRSLWNALNNRGTRYFGQISYSVYLYHGLCRRFVESVLEVHETYSVAVLGLLCSVIVSSASFYLVEKTFIRFGRSRRTAASQVEPAEALSERSFASAAKIS